MEIPEKEARDCGFGPRPVRVLPSVFAPCTRDGSRLAVRLWLPSNRVPSDYFPGVECWSVYAGDSKDEAEAEQEDVEVAFPVVLEYLPYRKDDITAARDHRRHTWMASHGVAVARADLRGSGDSDGLYADEYTDQELEDGRDLIAWLAGQAWSNGRVGLYGKSWGGFNGLQLAALSCPGLAAVVSLYSTDDRFNCDIHYTGGCVLGTDGLTWSSFMLAINSLPPSPAVRPDDWRECWRARLESAGHRPWLDTWLRHQTLDAYWRRGSVGWQLERLTVPVLLIGGWRDLYADALLRMADRLPNQASCALLGPWSHDWPDTGLPGPNIAFLDECLRWWRLHLDAPNPAVSDAIKPAPPSRFRAFQRIETAPPRNAELWRGRWLAAGSYAELLQPGGVKFYLSGDQQLVYSSADQRTTSAWSVDISSRTESGLAYPEFLSFGDPDEAPDQSIVNRMATVWRLDSLQRDLDLFGSPEVTLDLRLVEIVSDDGSAARAPTLAAVVASPTIGVRLCEIDPVSGRESLLAWGVANLNLTEDQSEPRRFTGGSVVVRLRAVSRRVARGRGLLLALSAGLWPLAWRCPSRPEVRLRLVGGGGGGSSTEHSLIRLPVLRPSNELKDADDALLDGSLGPRLGPALPTLSIIEDKDGEGGFGTFGAAAKDFRRWLEWDLVGERWVHHMASHYCPPLELLLQGRHRVQMSWRRHYWQGIGGGRVGDEDPTSEAEHQLRVCWPGCGVDVTVLAKCSLRTDPTGREFQTGASLRILLNGEHFFRRLYADRIANATAC